MKVNALIGGEVEVECLGCSIAKREVELVGGELFRTNNFNVSQDYEIPIPGFMIVGSNEHKTKITDFDDEGKKELGMVIGRVREAMYDALGVDKITLIQEEGSKHFHVWLFPWYGWMGKEQKIARMREIMEKAREERSDEKGLQEVEIAALRIKEKLN